MKWTIRHWWRAQRSCGCMPRKATSCGRKEPVAARKKAKLPEKASASAVRKMSERPSPIRAPRKVGSGVGRFIARGGDLVVMQSRRGKVYGNETWRGKEIAAPAAEAGCQFSRAH